MKIEAIKGLEQLWGVVNALLVWVFMGLNRVLHIEIKDFGPPIRGGHVRVPAFTLAEILITLGIIGVVAAISIPTLMANVNARQWTTAKEVFNKKLNESLKTMNIMDF